MALRWRCCRGLRSSACPPCSATLCVSSPGSYFANHFIMGGEKFDSTHPEGYLFGENSDLNFLGNRPVVVGISGSGLCLLSVCLLSILHEGRDSQALGVGPVDSLVSNIKADRLLSPWVPIHVPCGAVCPSAGLEVTAVSLLSVSWWIGL